MSGEETANDGVGELRLGDISYSNCFPIHARLVDSPRPGDPTMIRGVPSLLNRLLREREIDVAPSSSIEFARNSDRYRILPDLVIGSRGPVRSILFLSRRNPMDLDGAVVALPTASATSVVLLKILLSLRWECRPTYTWFDQSGENPFFTGADAALFIGDVALQPGLHHAVPYRFDLGEVWFRSTGLPFAFAVWQASGGSPRQLDGLHRLLVESRSYFHQHQARLAKQYSATFGLPPHVLAEYWSGLTYDLDAPTVEGLRSFYRLAADIGELEAAPPLTWA